MKERKRERKDRRMKWINGQMDEQWNEWIEEGMNE